MTEEQHQSDDVVVEHHQVVIEAIDGDDIRTAPRVAITGPNPETLMAFEIGMRMMGGDVVSLVNGETGEELLAPDKRDIVL